jgi:hypothetical protein
MKKEQSGTPTAETSEEELPPVREILNSMSWHDRMERARAKRAQVIAKRRASGEDPSAAIAALPKPWEEPGAAGTIVKEKGAKTRFVRKSDVEGKVDLFALAKRSGAPADTVVPTTYSKAKDIEEGDIDGDAPVIQTLRKPNPDQELPEGLDYYGTDVVGENWDDEDAEAHSSRRAGFLTTGSSLALGVVIGLAIATGALINTPGPVRNFASSIGLAPASSQNETVLQPIETVDVSPIQVPRSDEAASAAEAITPQPEETASAGSIVLEGVEISLDQPTASLSEPAVEAELSVNTSIDLAAFAAPDATETAPSLAGLEDVHVAAASPDFQTAPAAVQTAAVNSSTVLRAPAPLNQSVDALSDLRLLNYAPPKVDVEPSVSEFAVASVVRNGPRRITPTAQEARFNPRRASDLAPRFVFSRAPAPSIVPSEVSGFAVATEASGPLRFSDRPNFISSTQTPSALDTVILASAPADAPIAQKPVAEEPALAIPDRIRVHVHAPTNVPEESVQSVLGTLSDTGFSLRDPARVGFTVSKTHVRFYHSEDAEMAAIVANNVGGAARDFTSFRPSPPDGVIEVWVSGEPNATAKPRTQRRQTTRQTPRRQPQRARPSADDQINALKNRLIQRLQRGDHL